MKLACVAMILLLAADASAQTSPRLIVQRDSVPTYVNEARNIGMTVLLDKASVGSDVGVSIGTFLPGTVVPEHVHAGSAEIMYVLNGEVEVTINGRTIVARAGSAVYVPADAPHSARVLGSIEPFKMVQVYAPGGPEQRFKAWKPQ
ncbi:MAG: cupin domain-containing protein [Gemmatimonadetes bacterium]|nr:cupin domain-containing protein [Gemmatimonadota bacterium]